MTLMISFFRDAQSTSAPAAKAGSWTAPDAMRAPDASRFRRLSTPLGADGAAAAEASLFCPQRTWEWETARARGRLARWAGVATTATKELRAAISAATASEMQQNGVRLLLQTAKGAQELKDR